MEEKIICDKSTFVEIADAIRAREGTNEQYYLYQFPEKVRNLYKNMTPDEIGAYPKEAVRVVNITIPVSGWSGSGPFTYNITNSTVTANTDCRFELGSSINRLVTDINWTTSTGKIALNTSSKPTGELSGKCILTEIIP